MAERRPLTEGLRTAAVPMPASVDPKIEKDFVYGVKPKPEASPTTTAAQNLSRVPLSTRIRGDFAAALKRASLERQLSGVDPHTLQDILEQAIEPWLKSNGYLR